MLFFCTDIPMKKKMCNCLGGQTQTDGQTQKILLCRMLTKDICQAFRICTSLTLHCIVLRVQKTCVNVSFLSHVSQKLHYDHT